jgi:radical SAM protein with 4Fe4S-binding SPASM domain
MIYPSHLQIENVTGICSAHCVMCPVHTLKRKPNIMDIDTFKVILDKFLPYRDHFQYLSIFGMGEPLHDKGLPDKIRMAKEMGFRGVGIATNCSLLDRWKSLQLITSGLDTLICSVDGITKETHEAIRVGTNYDQVVENIRKFIDLRQNCSVRTKVVVRFIRQQSNQHEWKEYQAFWKGELDAEYGDAVISYDVQDYDGKVKEYDSKDVLTEVEVPAICRLIDERMIVFSRGEIAFCCADSEAEYSQGNVLDGDPMEIYNNEKKQHYRDMIHAGRREELELCKGCTIPRSAERKDKV